ncbi:MAG: YbaB/EbfC family nucleoid-associated protein [Flavobacteriales bacterium]|nr:YbaB/EbfC family nucleoid-associated protein [Flavobacteriales bacterium]
MFGKNMMGKLQEMQKQIEETKARLNNVTVYGEAEGIRVTVNGNRRLTDISIPETITDREDIQDLVLTAANRALEQADRINEAEMANSARGIMPNFPGFGQ